MTRWPPAVCGLQGTSAPFLPAVDPAAAWQQYSAAWAALESRLSGAKTGGEYVAVSEPFIYDHISPQQPLFHCFLCCDEPSPHQLLQCMDCGTQAWRGIVTCASVPHSLTHSFTVTPCAGAERLHLRLEDLAWPLPSQYGLEHYSKAVLQDVLLCDVQVGCEPQGLKHSAAWTAEQHGVTLTGM